MMNEGVQWKDGYLKGFQHRHHFYLHWEKKKKKARVLMTKCISGEICRTSIPEITPLNYEGPDVTHSRTGSISSSCWNEDDTCFQSGRIQGGRHVESPQVRFISIRYPIKYLATSVTCTWSHLIRNSIIHLGISCVFSHSFLQGGSISRDGGT